MILTEAAYAKVNLALHVRRRRDDGYHELETVFAFCEHGDVLTAELAGATSLTIDGPFADGLSTTDNLVVRAADVIGVTARLHLTKNLPVASGIGGGSADAAAALRLLARLSGRGLPSADVQRALGADVPACVGSQTMRGEGVGEALSPVSDVTGTPILLVNPCIPLSTAAVFQAWDGIDRGPLADWREGRNDLEAPAWRLVPEIADLVAWLARRHDVTLARMSGSGATCFALFASEAARARAVHETTETYPGYWAMESVLR
ncbi:4-(cytidine 5'-diphospho)-2-C-methyl-D-erythritol kinase [Sphingomonas sp. SUN039]|uniref:4-(cytidine 5'-diphospho)-2-C-methyl-D-erythritol kinase n=1 Tax=Sphingomonas sp. SUN039 TaxID=2937787 RepID=UPI0021646144|nr:4-(cytidine 5'-diphospho)-2-C-methyl-D-erythritol kinase [Sphingomonas sp. SUN039]UVO53879.1 4-(cytidine 5'-diphospho)-2-C-methyl-D-erythritol kinase [Sphingomonas sp. SUN039]